MRGSGSGQVDICVSIPFQPKDYVMVVAQALTEKKTLTHTLEWWYNCIIVSFFTFCCIIGFCIFFPLVVSYLKTIKPSKIYVKFIGSCDKTMTDKWITENMNVYARKKNAFVQLKMYTKQKESCKL